MSDWSSRLGWICLEIGNGMSMGSLLCGYLVVIIPSVRGIVGMEWMVGLLVLLSCYFYFRFLGRCMGGRLDTARTGARGGDAEGCIYYDTPFGYAQCN